MTAPAKKQTLFDLSGGHPALDLVNSLDNRFRADGPNENLVQYSDLLRFLSEVDLLDSQRIRLLGKTASEPSAGQVLREVRELREATAAVFYAAMEGRTPAHTDIETLQRRFREAGQHRELLWTPAGKRPAAAGAATAAADAANDHNHDPDTPAHLAWQWRRNTETDPNLPLWLLAQSVSDILLSQDAARVRTCAVDTCRWLFLDTSKNHTRRWCNMKVCGNRMKARRFQARRDS
jgi:predicted RNA-binding Zn ribbon-like protein